MDARIAAFLKLITYTEGTSRYSDPYRVLVGGGYIKSLSGHPNIKVYIRSINDDSTAAGAYQFLKGTWDEVAAQEGLADFSPRSQDIGAINRIKKRGAYNLILNGQIEAAIQKCSKEWASFPYNGKNSYYPGQSAYSMSECVAKYYEYLNGGGSRVSNVNTIVSILLIVSVMGAGYFIMK